MQFNTDASYVSTGWEIQGLLIPKHFLSYLRYAISIHCKYFYEFKIRFLISMWIIFDNLEAIEDLGGARGWAKLI